ncbi:MAG TPA: glycosyltransferase family 1 protein [Candidatus Moranbacteria bacterium]|nr:glycosyltransferase family 1 protein [Candidatus Moranbacteria bacterium]
MRIGIDARFFGPIGKGLGRYTQKLIENLEKVDDTNEYFIFLKAENFDEYQPKNKNFQKVLANYRWYTFAEQIKMPFLLRKYKLDLVHFPHFNVPLLYFGKFIVTIHDLILLRFPTIRSSTLSPLAYWFKFMAYKVVINLAIRRACTIIGVSNFTKNDILKKYPKILKEKIFVTYEACDDFCFFNPKKYEQLSALYGIIRPYILYVGNVYPHKNPERLILATKEVAKEFPELKLVFVGGEDYFYRRLKELIRKQNIQNIIFSGFVPDYDLDAIFRNSLAYIRPSLHEGFELPALEAMARGVPVVAAEYECSKEILGDSAYYFDGEDISDIARAIKEILRNEKLRDELIKKGYDQAKKYSWKRMAQKTLELYQSAKNKI